MKKINRVLTALGNPKKSNELKNLNINVVANDIQYREGIIEYLENNNNINFLIIDEEIPGNCSLHKLANDIYKINKKIKVIIISENDLKFRIYRKITSYDSKEIANIINKENIFNKQQIPINNVFNENTKDAEIITILGTNGIGKSIFSIVFANQIKNKKILIIDFDILNNSIHSLLGIKDNNRKVKEELKTNQNSSNQVDIHDYLIQTKHNIDLISGIKLIYNSKKQPSTSRIRNLILSLKKEYDVILIDTSSESLLEYTKQLITISDNSIFISGANMLEIRKSEKLLKIYNKDWRVPNHKINMIFNKCTNKSIDDEVLRRVFKKYNILGKIKLSDYYDLAINKNNAKILQIEKEISIIKKKYNQSKKRKLKIKKIKK